jgi:hypothetical protein
VPTLLYQRWEGPVMVADAAPARRGPKSTQGLYALKPGHLGGLPCLGSMALDAQLGWCVGTVGLFGKIVEGEAGYRAEKAVIRSLWLATPYLWVAQNQQIPAEVVVEKLAARYDLAATQCHVGLPRELEEHFR